jgi:shikimate kinase
MSRAAKASVSLAVDRTIALVGMMGAGKTTVGRRLARALALPFKDADEEIERAAGMSVSELFAAHGEESFRRGEAQVIERLLAGPPVILATGGGALTAEKTRALLHAKALTIWLKADAETLAKRATRRPTRPLLANGDPQATIERLLAARTPLYEEAAIHIDSRKGPHGETVDAILSALRAHFSTEPR